MILNHREVPDHPTHERSRLVERITHGGRRMAGRSRARYEFFEGPLDTEMCFVPTNDDGDPVPVVYSEYAPGVVGNPSGPGKSGWPRAVNARFIWLS